MNKVAIVTDSNSGITQASAKELGVFVLPMPFLIDDEEYFEDINLTQQQFYEKLTANAKVCTSQPSIESKREFWDKILKDYDQIVEIPMSSGLSQTCENAKVLAEQYNGRVEVVDNHRISVTLKQSVLDAQKLAKMGKNAKEIKEILEAEATNSSIYITLTTLKYLKRGGRITPTAAAIGTLLGIKPVLQIQGGKLDAFCKVLNIRTAKQKMIAQIKKDLQTRFSKLLQEGRMTISVAHTNNLKMAEEFKQEILQELKDFNVEFTYIDPLSLSIACHIGNGSLAVTATAKL